MTFGDYEPEDAWQADDPVPAQIANLFARLRLLEAGIARDFVDVNDLDTIQERLIAWRLLRSNPSVRDAHRAAQLEADVSFVRARL